MGLILDLAVSGLALLVIGSLALLAWTLAVSAVQATRQGRRQIADMRHSVTDAEARVRSASDRASTALAELRLRTDRYATPGDRSDR